VQNLAKRAFKVVPIGVVESIGEVAKIRVFPRFCDGLYRLSEFSHVVVFYWFHGRDTENERHVLRVTPKRHQARQEVGVFASRSPSRPNPIGLCVVKLLRIEGCRLTVTGLMRSKIRRLLMSNLICRTRISFQTSRFLNGQATEGKHDG
jgi:tRNA-Thr(GGU) m(6)t(6)A37 methyltransferase TsaA